MTPVSLFLQLPPILRELIFAHLDSQSRLNVRLVCKLFQDDIDGGTGLILRLKQTPNKKFSKLLSRVCIDQLTLTENACLCTTGVDSFLDPTCLHTFTSETMMELHQLEKLLKSCYSLTRLELCSSILNTLKKSTEKTFLLPNLKTLTILPNVHLISEAFISSRGSRAAMLASPLTVLSQIYSPSLRLLHLKIWVCEKTDVTHDYAMEKLIKFLFLHSKTLTTLRFSLRRMESAANRMEQFMRSPPKTLVEQMEKLGRKLDDLKTICIDHEAKESPWIPFVITQKSLKIFEYTNPLQKWEEITPAIINSGPNLTCLELTLGFCRSLDFRVISKNCVNLQTLKLLKGNQVSSVRVSNLSPPVYDLVNVEEFPPKITNMVFTYIRVEKDTWEKLVELKQLKRLIIVLERNNVMGYEAVPVSVLLKILQFRHLRVLLLTRLQCDTHEDFLIGREICSKLMSVPKSELSYQVNLTICIS